MTFYPVQNGQWEFLKTQKLISGMLDMATYNVRGGYVVFDRDITGSVLAVDMQLVLMPFDKFGEYDALPIPAGVAIDVVREVANILLNTPVQTKISDPVTEVHRQ